MILDNLKNIFLFRHTLASLAYRGGKTIRGVSESFPQFKVTPQAKAPIFILAHINDLFDWTIHLIEGESIWVNSSPSSWDDETKRFHAGLQKIDDLIVSGAEMKCSFEKLFQGPVADALTHIGQIAYLRRLAGIPVMGENYFVADIELGRLGADQNPSKIEFI